MSGMSGGAVVTCSPDSSDSALRHTGACLTPERQAGIADDPDWIGDEVTCGMAISDGL